MYLTTQDWPTIYKLSLEDPFSGRSAGTQSGQAVYEERCQTCHGVKGAGSGLGPPALAGVNGRLGFDSFRQVVRADGLRCPRSRISTATNSTNCMPTSVTPAERRRRHPRSCLRDQWSGRGARREVWRFHQQAARYSQLGGPPYPAGIDAPKDRYYTEWGLYPDQPFVISPPWSSLVAYDLNKGTIKWKVPLGEDAKAAAEGAKDTGAFMAEQHGMIVTSTGLLFVATSDGKVRAHDEDTGKVLWTATLPGGSEGIPSMYEVNGRQYLVVPASSKINSGGGHKNPGSPASGPAAAAGGAYVAFALPESE